MASKAERLRKVYEVKIGKKIVDKLSDKQIKILSAFYNSLGDKEQSDLDSQIVMGRNNTELHEMAIGMIEEEENTEDKIPEGLDDLLNEISGNKKTATKTKRKRGRPKKKASSTLPGKLTEYSKTEDVDSRILQLLGLDDVFDLDYDDYANLLKEKLIEVSKGTDDSSTEDAMLLREELKKARGNKGKGAFKIKKKISKDSFTNFNVGRPKKDTAQTKKPAYALLQGKKINEQSQKVEDLKSKENKENKESKQSDKQILKSISKSLDRIIGILSKQLKFDKKQTEKQRKLEEKGKRKDKENKMESTFSKGIKSLAKVASKIFSPLQDLFGRIVRFLTIIFLGKVVKKFVDWFTNPKNQSKVETLGRLLKTFWPAILAGLIFLNPLGRLITKAVFIIGKGVARLLKVAIPSLLKFARRNPKLAAATALFTAGATIPMIFPGTVDEQERKTGKEVSEKGENRTRKELERKANEPNFYERLTGQDSEAKEQLYKLDTGETKSYKRGGKITTESGKDIKGAGVDTQLIAARPGEIVINKETVNAVGADHFLGLNKQYGGANANKPKTVRGVQTASGGGLVLPAFANGGRIGEGPEESRLQKRRKPSTPEDIAAGLDSNLVEWAKANPTLARALKAGDIGYKEAQKAIDYGSNVVQQIPKVAQPAIDYGSNVVQQIPKVAQPAIDYGSNVVEGISKIPSKIEENIPSVQGFADAGAEALPAILSGFLGIKRTDRSISRNMQRAMLHAQKTATEKGRDFIEYEDYSDTAGGIAGKYTMGRVADSEFTRDAQGRIIGMSQAYDTNRPADESMAQAWAKSKKFLGIDNSKDIEKFNRLVRNRMSSEGASEEEIQKNLIVSGGERGQMGDLKTAIYKPFEALLDISQKMHGGKGSTTHEIIFDKDVLGFDPVEVAPAPITSAQIGSSTQKFDKGDYSGATKALGGDLSKPVPIPQITQGAIPKPKTNQQKLIEKRPWYDKFGLFGGASRLQKKEGGGIINGSTEKGGGFNLLNPASWFSGDAQKATRGELGSVNDNSLAGKLYNKRRKQEEMMKELGYQSGGYIKENSGMNVLGGADRQKIITQPGEYVLPVDTVMDLGGPQKIDRIVADTDSNSSPAKMGLRNKDISEGILPYETQGSGGIDIETLPLSGLGGMGGSSGGLNSPNGTQDEFFSPISSAGLSERQRFMDTIGISAFG